MNTISWTADSNAGPMTGYDDEGNRYEGLLGRIPCTCYLKSGFWAKGESPRDAYEKAKQKEIARVSLFLKPNI